MRGEPIVAVPRELRDMVDAWSGAPSGQRWARRVVGVKETLVTGPRVVQQSPERTVMFALEGGEWVERWESGLTQGSQQAQPWFVQVPPTLSVSFSWDGAPPGDRWIEVDGTQRRPFVLVGASVFTTPTGSREWVLSGQYADRIRVGEMGGGQWVQVVPTALGVWPFEPEPGAAAGPVEFPKRIDAAGPRSAEHSLLPIQEVLGGTFVSFENRDEDGDWSPPLRVISVNEVQGYPGTYRVVVDDEQGLLTYRTVNHGTIVAAYVPSVVVVGKAVR